MVCGVGFFCILHLELMAGVSGTVTISRKCVTSLRSTSSTCRPAHGLQVEDVDLKEVAGHQLLKV